MHRLTMAAATLLVFALAACTGTQSPLNNGSDGSLPQTAAARQNTAQASTNQTPQTVVKAATAVAPSTTTDTSDNKQMVRPQSGCVPGGPITLTPTLNSEYGSVSGETITLTAASRQNIVHALVTPSQYCVGPNFPTHFAITPSPACTAQLATIAYNPTSNSNYRIVIYPVSINGSCSVLVTGGAGQTATFTIVVAVPAVHLIGSYEFNGGTYGADKHSATFAGAGGVVHFITNYGNSDLQYTVASNCGTDIATVTPTTFVSSQSFSVVPATQNGTCSATVTGFNGSTDTVPIVVAVAPPTITAQGGFVRTSGTSMFFTMASQQTAAGTANEEGMSYGFGRPFSFATTCTQPPYVFTIEPKSNGFTLAGTNTAPPCTVTATGFSGQTAVLNVNH